MLVAQQAWLGLGVGLGLLLLLRVRVRVGVGVGVRVRVGVLGSDREPSLVIQRRWVSPSLTMGTIGWCSVHANTHRVLLHRPLRDAEHGEGQTGAAELDAKSHPTVRWLYRPALAV